ncbi:MAG: hypothetical protein MOP51_1861 [Citricoccus sp.]|jgi:hypothetical protein|nr:hypothetical protein [Citricoccus sp. WCRC_4]
MPRTEQAHEPTAGGQGGDHQQHGSGGMYLRFAAMILTGMVVMYFTMFAGSWEWSHVRWSESRFFMTLTMGGAMVVVMLAWMLHMYKNPRANIAIIIGGVLLLGGGIALDRSQVTVDDTDYMSAMIPHHSLAITRSERAGIEDVRVCQLAADISKAQREEIEEMEWLIQDIRQNGPATTAEQAQARPAPTIDRTADRQCPSTD